MEVRRIYVDSFRIELGESEFVHLISISTDKNLTMEAALFEVIERGLIECLGDITGKD